MPAIGRLPGGHASVHQRKRGAADRVAIEEEPFDSVISETTRIV